MQAALPAQVPQVDPGVKGLRPRSRTYSSDAPAAATATPTLTAKKEPDMSALTRWGSENPEELARKTKVWLQMRQQQQHDIANKASVVDAVKAAVVLYVLTKLSRLAGVSPVKSLSALAAAALARGLWAARAPARSLPPDAGFQYTNWPIFGEIGFVPEALRDSMAIHQVRIAKLRNFKSGELVMFGGTRDISLMEPQDREYMLRGNWKNFTKNCGGQFGFQEMFAEIMGRGIFAVDGDEWTDHRKVSAHLFSANGLRSKMESSFTEHGAKLVELLSTVADSGRVLDWQDVMAGLTFETICEIAFGVDPNAMEPGLRGEKIPFLVQFDRLQQLCAMRFIVPAPIWKTLRWLNVGTERTIREDAENISRYVQKIIQERQASGSWATQDDLLSMYIQTARSTGKEYMETAEYLQDAVLNFMIAGRDTTSSTLTNLFKLLPQNPAAEARMVEEFARVVGRGKHVQWDHVRELRFGGAVFNEVLRMYPPVSGDVRICNQTDTLPSGLVVPAGTRTSITNAAIGRDPSLWSDPDAFNPSRWLGEDPTQPTRRVDEMMHPVFWGGPRLCLGKDMARLEVLSIAWTVLQKFRLDVLPHSELKVNGPVQFYEHGLPVRVQARGAA